jgi:hypothetical protein
MFQNLCAKNHLTKNKNIFTSTIKKVVLSILVEGRPWHWTQADEF